MGNLAYIRTGGGSNQPGQAARLRVQAQAKPLPDSAKVKAFARRLGQFVSANEFRPAVTGACRVAPGVWAATCGHQLSLLPSPILANGSRFGDDLPTGVIFRPADLATLADCGVPIFAEVLRPERTEPAQYGRGVNVIPAKLQWQAAAGEAIVWQIDANFPDYTKVVPKLADLPNSLTVDPAAIRALLASADDGWTPAEKLRGGTGKLGAKVKRGDGTVVKFAANGKMACTVTVAKKVCDDDGNATGAVVDEVCDLGDLGDEKAVTAFSPWLLLAVADSPFDLRYSDEFSPAMAVCHGEAHVVMPMRL